MISRTWATWALALLLVGGMLHAQALPPVPSTPIKVIIDSDIGSDLDDAHAIAIALRLQQLGYFRIIALTSSTWLDKAPAFLHLMLNHGGLTVADVPIGAYQGPRPAFSGGSCWGQDSADNYLDSVLNSKLVAPDPDSVPNLGRATFPDAVMVIRRALGSAADASVVFTTLGGFTNVAAVMKSPANYGDDGYPSGMTLWSTKVSKLVSQLSGFPNTYPYNASLFNASVLGFNSSCDAPAADYVFTNNGSVPIIGNPMQVSMYLGGCYNGLGAGCTSAMPALSPTRMATALWDPAKCPTCLFTLGAGNKGRPAWDPGAVFFALVGATDPGGGAYFILSTNGTMSYAPNFPASSTWTTATSSNHYFAINTSRWSVQQSIMNSLLQDDYLPTGVPQAQPPLPVSVTRCDLNSDNKVDVADVLLAIGQVQGTSACGTADITGDGKCNLWDVQRVVAAALTGTCQVGL